MKSLMILIQGLLILTPIWALFFFGGNGHMTKNDEGFIENINIYSEESGLFGQTKSDNIITLQTVDKQIKIEVGYDDFHSSKSHVVNFKQCNSNGCTMIDYDTFRFDIEDFDRVEVTYSSHRKRSTATDIKIDGVLKSLTYYQDEEKRIEQESEKVSWLASIEEVETRQLENGEYQTTYTYKAPTKEIDNTMFIGIKKSNGGDIDILVKEDDEVILYNKYMNELKREKGIILNKNYEEEYLTFLNFNEDKQFTYTWKDDNDFNMYSIESDINKIIENYKNQLLAMEKGWE